MPPRRSSIRNVPRAREKSSIRARLRSRLEKGITFAWWLVLKLTHDSRRRAERLQLFDAEWYLANYPDVATAGHDPFLHYVSIGAAEGRDPGPNFSTLRYLQSYPDLGRAGVNSLLHYLDFGMREGRKIFPADTTDTRAQDYHRWIERHDYSTPKEAAKLRRRAKRLSRRPLLSIIMPTYNTRTDLLRAAIDSVLAQIYDRWELCIADDASTDPEVRNTLAHYAATDARIKVIYREKQGGISSASSTALEIATAEWVAMLDHDDLLAPHALLRVAEAINAKPRAQVIYSDEDKITETGYRFGVYFKPDFSLELFRSQNYLNHLTVHRAANIRAVGAWRPAFDGSQDYDLNLRIIERIPASTICHIPEVLYHWRVVSGSTALSLSEKSWAYTAGLRALNDHVQSPQASAIAEDAAESPPTVLRFASPRPAPWSLSSYPPVTALTCCACP